MLTHTQCITCKKAISPIDYSCLCSNGAIILFLDPVLEEYFWMDGSVKPYKVRINSLGEISPVLNNSNGYMENIDELIT